jgi:hypothetical protein
VTHGTGFLGSATRDAEERMSEDSRTPEGDHEASWAAHAVVFIGDHNFSSIAGKPDINPAIVEAEWPKVIISRADRHSDTIWATGQPLTLNQRKNGVIEVLKLVGTGYDLRAYGWFIARAAQLHLTHNLAPLFTDPHLSICSGLVMKEQKAMNVDITTLMTAAINQPDFVSPADCLRWGLDHHWMSSTPGNW